MLEPSILSHVGLTVQVGTELHCAFEPQVAVPEPDHPGLHVTVTVASIIPVKELVAALLEFGTSVDGQLDNFSQLVSSLGMDEYVALPSGQAEQEPASENGCTSGDDIYLLAGQHPNCAVLDPRE